MSLTISDLQGAIAHLKDNISLSDVIGEVVDLKDAGPDLKKGLCCFHEEKTPSLTLTPSKGLYYCFGCHATGDIISFYREYYNNNTIEAVNNLAEKYEIDITEYKRELTEEEKYHNSLKNINKWVANKAHDILSKGNNKGVQYLVSRGISREIAEEFKIGYSPELKDIFPSHIKDTDALNKLGISSSNYMQWTDAIVYPIYDATGDIIGFKNRPNHTTDGGPKFIGTSNESPVMASNNLYGFHIARKHLTGDNRIILVEGQHDVLVAHMNGIRNVAGTDSTALNRQKMETLEKYGVKEVIIAYDGDNAGREASMKIAETAKDLSDKISIKIASLPQGYDPDEFIRDKGAMEFNKIIHDAVYSSQYIIDRIADQMPLLTVTNKLDFVRKCEPVLMSVDSFEREFIVAYVAEKIGVHPDLISDMLRDKLSKNSKSLLYNIDGEKIVLGGMLREEDFRLRCLDELKDSDFYLHKHRLLFDMIKDMDFKSVPITIDTLKSTMNNRELKQIFNDGAYIDDIYSTVGSHEILIDDIIDKSMRRSLIEQADMLKSKANNMKNNVVFISEEHLDKVEEIASGNSGLSTIATPETGSSDFMDTLHDRMQNAGQITGLDMGENFKNLTGLLNGLQPKKLITISANQSVGKTTLTANIINHIAITDKKPWAHFSLEMPKEEVITKIIGMRAGVNTQRIERGNVTDEEYARIKQATIDYYSGGLFVIDDCHTLESIVNRIRTLLRNHNIEGVSIDYLQLMSLEKSFGKKKYEEEGEISGALKNDVAMKFGIPVIAVSQMSRRALDRDIQRAEDGQGAYKIAQDSDVYMILQNKSDEEIEEYGIERGNQIINLDKNRGGMAGVLIDIFFNKDLQRMSEVNNEGEHKQ